MAAYAYGILGRASPWDKERRLDVCRDYVETVNRNIEEFLRNRHSLILRLESAQKDFPTVWEWIGAEGDLSAGLAEFAVAYNAS